MWLQTATTIFIVVLLVCPVDAIEIDDSRFAEMVRTVMRGDMEKIRESCHSRSSETDDILPDAPVGTILPFAGYDVSTLGNWLLCDGRILKQEDYPTLYAAIGQSYKSEDFDEAEQFQIPDFRGRALVGAGQGTGLTSRVVGSAFGAEKHLLSAGEMPSHSHTVNDPGHAHTYDQHFEQSKPLEDGRVVDTPFWPSGKSMSVSTEKTGISLASAGSNQAHENMQPSLAISFIIKAPAIKREPAGTPWPAPANLQAFWPLGSLQQTRDIGPNQVETTAQPLTYTSGPFGQADSAVKPVQSNSGIISSRRVAAEGSFTVAMFLKRGTDTSSQGGGIFEFLDMSGTTKAFQLRFKGVDTIEVSANAVTIGEYTMVQQKGAWTFFAATFDYDTALYTVYGKHGVVSPPIFQTSVIASNSFNNNGMRLGYATRWNEGFQSTDAVACLMVYNTALSAKHIKQAHDACRVVQVAPLCGSPKLPIAPIPSATSLTTIPNPGEFPYIASLLLNSKHVCSAVIIDQFWLVTSALCFEETSSPSSYSVNVGEYDLSKTETFTVTHSVAQVILSSNSERGMALVEVTEPIDMTSDYANDACLFTSDMKVDLNWNGNEYVFGWGINGRKPMVSQSLGRYVPGTMMTEAQCSQSDAKGYDPSTDFCFLSSTNDRNVPCTGDEGSPLLVVAPGDSSNGISERLVSVGLYFSHGANCSTMNPALFVDVSKQMGWITQQIACAVPGVAYPTNCPQA